MEKIRIRLGWRRLGITNDEIEKFKLTIHDA